MRERQTHFATLCLQRLGEIERHCKQRIRRRVSFRIGLRLHAEDVRVPLKDLGIIPFSKQDGGRSKQRPY